MKRLTKKIHPLHFAFGFASIVALGSIQSAKAATLRGTSSLCTIGVSAYDLRHDVSNGDITPHSGSGGGYVFCPFVEFDDFTKVDANAVNVYANDGDPSGTVIAAACWSDYSGSTHSCGPWALNSPGSNTGDVTLTPSLSEWDTTAGHAFIRVLLPDDSSFEGFYVST